MSFYTNGTFRLKTLITKDPILNFVRRHPHILFLSKGYKLIGILFVDSVQIHRFC